MQIATWNVNSLKMRLEHVKTWLEATRTDILCLQELKMTDEAFPALELEAAGYGAIYLGQKTYNGVAIVYRHETVEAPQDIEYNLPHFDDEQKRFIAATFPCEIGDVRVLCGYFPNGAEVGCEKYAYKLAWLKALTTYTQEALTRFDKLALLGDYNIAPEDRDVWNPESWAGNILVSPSERAAFQALLDLGLVDAFRLFEQPEKLFSWWDYRMLGFQKNHGLRIDHILLSEALIPWTRACSIDKAPRKWTKPSDHAPVTVKLGSV